MEKLILKVLVGIMCVTSISCTKYNYNDTGVSKGVYDCSMWDYFHTDSYNWDSTILMIKHAGMEDIFKGTSEYKEITFFGVKNHSIRSYLLENGMLRVEDMNVDSCKLWLSRLIVPKKIMRDEVTRGNYYTETADSTGTALEVKKGGQIIQCLSGSVWAYSYREIYNNVPEAGEVSLYIMSENIPSPLLYRVVTTNLQTTTGIVQALSYTYKLGKI